MQLPREARMWDIAAAPTVVLTEEGAARGDRIEQNRRDELERALRRRGVEVVASCIYMPEHPQGWTYAISLRLVSSAAQLLPRRGGRA